MALVAPAFTITVGSQVPIRQLPAYGGTPPYSWTVWKGKLPSALSLDSSGYIKGALAGSMSATDAGVQLMVQDSSGKSAVGEYYLDTHTTGFLFAYTRPSYSGMVGQSGTPAKVYTDQFFYWVPYIQGGNQPWTFFTTDALPDSLTCDPTTGTIQGPLNKTPPGLVKITVYGKDAADGRGTGSLTLQVSQR